MDILSNFSERLQELMLDRGIIPFELSKETGIPSSTMCNYASTNYLPSYKTLVTLVEYFDCSADFLLGLSEYPKRENQVFLPVVPFEIQFRKALSACGMSQYALQKKTRISWQSFHSWFHGTACPTSDTLVKIAKAMDCSIDFLLGREKE